MAGGAIAAVGQGLVEKAPAVWLWGLQRQCGSINRKQAADAGCSGKRAATGGDTDDLILLLLPAVDAP